MGGAGCRVSDRASAPIPGASQILPPVAPPYRLRGPQATEACTIWENYQAGAAWFEGRERVQLDGLSRGAAGSGGACP